jgi:hypothetical protein
MSRNSNYADINYDSIVAAKSKTIDFDNVNTEPYGFAVLENGYSKLNWENLYVLNIPNSGIEYYGNSGYITGNTSGDQVMYNPYSATDSSIYLNTGTFTFESVQMTSGWNISEKVTIKGYDESGDEIFSTKVKLTSKGPLDVELNWAGVNKVTFFYPEKFKQDPDLLGSGNNVVFDDLVVSKVKGTSGGADLDAHKIADGAFGMNSHHESIGSVHHVSDAAHPVNLHLA